LNIKRKINEISVRRSVHTIRPFNVPGACRTYESPGRSLLKSRLLLTVVLSEIPAKL